MILPTKAPFFNHRNSLRREKEESQGNQFPRQRDHSDSKSFGAFKGEILIALTGNDFLLPAERPISYHSKSGIYFFSIACMDALK